MSNFVKPQSPIYNKSTDTYIYPLTTSDQVIMPDGTRLDDNIGGMKMELLWENVSPSSEFAEQNITINLSEYKFLFISTSYGTCVVEVGGGFSIVEFNSFPIENNLKNIFYRFFSATSEYVSIGHCYYVQLMNVSVAPTILNSVAIPYRIYGIKGVSA